MNRILFFSIAFMLYSCSESFDKELETVDYSVAKRNRVENDIYNYISMSKHSDARSAGFHKLVPIIQNGDTVMYIANYDEGWDLFSNDRRVPMVIASSPTGHLDMNDLNMPSSIKNYINSVADELYEIKQQTSVEKETYGEWNMVYLDNDEVDLSKITTNSRTANDLQPGEGYWQLLEMSLPIRKSVTTEKLITTEWGQEYPWNLYIPYAQDDLTKKGPAGCTAVATGQYLYYLHYKYGVPAATITTATYNTTNNTYTYSENSSTSNYYTMNWGWNGSYNNTEFVADMDWNAGGHNFNTYKRIAKE